MRWTRMQRRVVRMTGMSGGDTLVGALLVAAKREYSWKSERKTRRRKKLSQEYDTAICAKARLSSDLKT